MLQLAERYEPLFYGNPLSGIIHDNVPIFFRSVEEAKNCFEYGCHLFQRSVAHASESSTDPADFPVDFESRIRQIIDNFEALHSKYSHELQAFVEARGSSFTPKEDIAVAVLQLHSLDNHISCYIQYLPPTHRLHWSEFMPQIQRMIMLGQKIIAHILSDSSCGESTISFNLDMGVIIPLYNLVRHCKDPIIRRQVISLLRSFKRQEGLWNSVLVANALDRIVEIEESTWSEADTYSDKVRPLTVDPILELDSRGGRLVYTRQGHKIDTQNKIVEEMFTW